MEKHLQFVQLCLPRLSPRDVCMLACTCTELRALRITWESHGRISFDLDGSPSAISWLHKNIISIECLALNVKFNPPVRLLRGLFVNVRNLTSLSVRGNGIRALPPLPEQLQYLDVSGCKKLLSLGALPPTLESLRCAGCAALEALPTSLSSTAVTELDCRGCTSLQELPALPECLDDLLADGCHSLRELPELPDALTSLQLEGCRSLQQLPELAHTDISYLEISGCRVLRVIPDLRNHSLEYLHASGLPLVTRLPALSAAWYDTITVDDSGITELPDPMPRINDELSCRRVPIQQLPAIAECGRLHLEGCSQLRQLPEQLPEDLRSLDISGCVLLQQLPAQLPSTLRSLTMKGCKQMQQLPAQLPASLTYLNCECCSSLQQLPDLAGSALQQLRLKGCAQLAGVQEGGCKNLVVHFN